MKVSTKWLNEYVPVLDLDREKLAEKIARTAVEIAGDYQMQDGLKKVVVGHVLSLEPHPDSDHLNVCQVDVGQEEPYQIVCGAPNIAQGQKVIVALPNSWIGGHTKIKKGKMRGIVSMGMICSLQELGFAEGVVPKEYADGIYVLPADATPGEEVFSYLGMDEDIIDVDITPNRADLLSMRGVAYEVAAMYDRQVTLPEVKVTEVSDDQVANYVSVQAPSDLVPTYQMRVIKDVKVGPSPLWIQSRLWNAGIRPINNVVDVTNYVLLEYGQPLHAFDYQTFATDKQVVVRSAQDGEKFVTLDGEDHELKTGDLVITDGQKPVGLAGIMGGLESEVTEKTQTVALEAAVFDGQTLRKTARRENFHTEASVRFERGINVATVREALDKAAMMIAELGQGQVVAGVAQANEVDTADREIEITATRINHVLGTSLSQTEVAKIFSQLGFGVTENGENLVVAVPVRRWDIEIDADLVEEVARIYGYDNIPTTLPTYEATPGKYTPKQKLIRDARQIMEASGLSQAISYGLTTYAKAQRFLLDTGKATELDFPMSSDHTTARMNLLSGLLDDLAYNVARKNEDVALYEQGRVFLRQDGSDRPTEIEHLAGAMTGLFHHADWQGHKTPADFFLAKGIVEHLLTTLGVSGVTYQATGAHEEMHPGRTADIYAGDVYLGFVGEVHPNLLKELRLKRTYVFELDLDKILGLDKLAQIYQPISKYPAVSRDIALAVNSDVHNQDLVDCIVKNGGKNLKEVKLFDLYQGEHLAKGLKSLAYSLVFQNADKTLVDEDVNQAFAKIEKALKEEFNVTVR